MICKKLKMENAKKLYLSKSDSLLLKGFAILMIVLHNYLHFQPGFGIENESDFNPNNVHTFLTFLYPFRWTETFSAIFAFLGHYGVQIFIFISAYGLSIQKITQKSPFIYKEYLFKRLKKLYFLLFFAVIVFQIFFFISFSEFYSFMKTAIKIVLLATSASNFTHESLYKMLSGPFWFFGLMVQLYFIFPVLFKIVKFLPLYQSILLTICMVYLFYFLDIYSGFSVFGTIIGHLPEVLLGIYFAQNKLQKTSLFAFILSCITFIFSQWYWFLFPLSFLSITVILLYLFAIIKPYLSMFWINVISYVGNISMILFIINGIFRSNPLFDIKDSVLRGERIFLFLFLLFFVSHFIHQLYIFLVKKLKI